MNLLSVVNGVFSGAGTFSELPVRNGELEFGFESGSEDDRRGVEGGSVVGGVDVSERPSSGISR